MDEPARDADQVIQGQQTQAANLHHQGLLGQAQSSTQIVCPVRTVQYIVAALPFAGRGNTDVVQVGQRSYTDSGVSDLSANAGCRSGEGGLGSWAGFLVLKRGSHAMHQLTRSEERPAAMGDIIARNLIPRRHD